MHLFSLTPLKAENKAPSSHLFAKRQAVNKISLIAHATENIQEPEAPEAKDALVTSISTIKAIAFAVMHTGGRQMTDPPHREKERQQQTV